MIILWLLVSVGVGIAVYYSQGCAAAFGAVAFITGVTILVGLVASC